MPKKTTKKKVEKRTNKQKFVDGVEVLYQDLFKVVSSGGMSGCVIEPLSPGLLYARDIYEELYPDRFIRARQIQEKIASLKTQLEYELDDKDDCDDDDY